MMKMSQTGGNLNEDEAIYANQNGTVDEDIYANQETIRPRIDGNDRKKQEGKLPGTFFFLLKIKRFHVTLFTVFHNCFFLKLGLIFSKPFSTLSINPFRNLILVSNVDCTM